MIGNWGLSGNQVESMGGKIMMRAKWCWQGLAVITVSAALRGTVLTSENPKKAVLTVFDICQS